MFRFENFWIEHPGFMDIVKLHWDNSPVYANAAKNLSSKLKQVRSGLRKWSKSLSNLNKLIYNCNWVLQLLDGLEDQRILSRLENSFRRLVKHHLSQLLDSKRKYWKQRNTIRWVKFGDENTQFFHSLATITHKRNFIVSLTNGEGDLITDHVKKANLIWNAFRERLGVSDFEGISYELGELLQEHDLTDLDVDFTNEEMDTVIKNLPNNHALGPDGFNGCFIKKCWSIIKDDFTRTLRDFCNLNTEISSINTSLIVLIPKKDNAKTVNDYRPISLLNYSLKCIIKILSSRL
jgi:hypothetical protein